MGLTSRFSVTGIRVRSSSDTVRIRYRAIVSHTVRVRVSRVSFRVSVSISALRLIRYRGNFFEFYHSHVVVNLTKM